MLGLRVFQAEQGDCLILRFGAVRSPRYLLVDGGPGGTYEAHLRPYLQRLGAKGRGLERVVLSHVDDDHVNGLLDLLAELRLQRTQGDPPLVEVKGVWHNSFQFSRGDLPLRGSPAAPTVRSRAASPEPALIPAASARSIAQGDSLRIAADALGIPVNQDFQGEPISTEGKREVELGDLTLRVVGPTRENLEELRRGWREWFE